MIKAILKIWPAFTPIILYILWVFIFEKLFRKIFRKKDYIDADFAVIGEKRQKIGKFSLKNNNFVIVLYISLIFMILSLVFLGVRPL
ncbi:MAG TPA: hypothetical protein VI861_02070 [Rickettsiales bacterium]|nr:hypothetical protein [Rickettsiales bacterium]